ncbi:hypothetical protein [Dactylosporangium sp. CS-033363]|uniref:hypothetical protein n=1 Tax=Dactylosporangium sp. CS-033363 TaxID=3239935 RepID=UPI003D925092
MTVTYVRHGLGRRMTAHGTLPPVGDWPGGTRYGLHRDRLLQDRGWTDADRAFAAKHHMELPDVDWLTTETWWDLPFLEMIEQEVPPATVYTQTPIVPWTAPLPPARTLTARQYGNAWWDIRLCTPAAAA